MIYDSIGKEDLSYSHLVGEGIPERRVKQFSNAEGGKKKQQKKGEDDRNEIEKKACSTTIYI